MTDAPLPPGFLPLLSEWFASRYGSPTPVQAAAWPRILDGEHLLVTAPTGSGKTLAVFLAAIDALASGRWPTGSTSVLYVSPLKALNNDIRRNLLTPLHELRDAADARGVSLPSITVATRSGDTPSAERQRMVRRPPEILITTPESLNIILASPRARSMLSNVRTVILDEVHAIVGSKRGTHLITAVERLARLAGEFQRIAVSATVRPLELVARFVGGRELVTGGADSSYRWREVGIVRAADTKSLELVVDFPETTEDVWAPLVDELRSIIARNRSTLIFVTTRRHAEKLTLLINDGEPEPIAYSHHGSLSRELRHFVEQALKAGELRAIVATNSLELGIDIGALDEVVMVKTPPTVSSTLQRLGRAGHRVGETSRGTIYPLYGRDMVDAAAMSAAVLERDIEEVRPVVAPLDVLAQVIVSMTAMQSWQIDDLYASVCTSWPYHTLERRHFDLVIEMLAGRYAETRIRELRPRISVDRVSGTVTAREGMTALLYQSGGTIPDRGYYALRLEGGAPVGELDEEFVWERRVGETFVFGSQVWTISRITDRDVIVAPAGEATRAIPFWRAEARGRDAHYARRLLDFLESCERAIVDDRLDGFLASFPQLAPRLRNGLSEILHAQRDATGTALPHRHHIVIERVMGGLRGQAEEESSEVIVHCGWGGRVNEPLAIVLAALWEREYGYPLEVFADNDALVLLLPADYSAEDAFGPARLRKLLPSGAIEALLRERLERSGRFGALFRENSGRALLLPRGGFSRRMPLWLNRLRSKKLLSATASLPDFPILLETWRECLSDVFDLDALRELVTGVADGEIVVSTCETLAPSPFASELVWQQINLRMYQDDSAPGTMRSSLSDDLLKEVARTDALRPMVSRGVVADVEARLTRLAPGYAPAGARELLEWAGERVVIAPPELVRLRAAVVRDHGEDAWRIAGAAERFAWVWTGEAWMFASRDRLPSIAALYPEARLLDPDPDAWDESPPEPDGGADGAPDGPGERIGTRVTALVSGLAVAETAAPSPEDVLAELLRFAGPVALEDGAARFGLSDRRWRELVASLHEADVVVVGRITDAGSETEVCEAETLEYLLRVRRASQRPTVEPVPAERLVPLWAATTRLASGNANPDALVELLDVLFGFTAPAGSWESDLIPARLDEYYPLWLDGLFAEHELIWMGGGSERIRFCLASEAALFQGPARGRTADGADPGADPVVAILERSGPLDLLSICDRVEGESADVTTALWDAAWRGMVSNDTYQTVRRGVETRFTPAPVARPEPATSGWPTRRGARSAARGAREWRATRPVSGRWFAIETDEPADPIAADERERERARVLLRRYGVVFRELVQREGDPFDWKSVFRALRLMELAGEVVSGVFLDRVGSPQFARRSAIELLDAAGRDTRVVWMSAVDPASPCGLGLSDVYPDLPSRLPSNHLVFRGPELLMTSRRNGRELSLSVGPDDPDIGSIVAPLRNLVTRRWNPLTRVVVETVNGVPVRESEYAPALARAGFRDEYRTYVMSAPYR